VPLVPLVPLVPDVPDVPELVPVVVLEHARTTNSDPVPTRRPSVRDERRLNIPAMVSRQSGKRCVHFVSAAPALPIHSPSTQRYHFESRRASTHTFSGTEWPSVALWQP
jgi:hypothetical protein